MVASAAGVVRHGLARTPDRLTTNGGRMITTGRRAGRGPRPYARSGWDGGFGGRRVRRDPSGDRRDDKRGTPHRIPVGTPESASPPGEGEDSEPSGGEKRKRKTRWAGGWVPGRGRLETGPYARAGPDGGGFGGVKRLCCWVPGVAWVRLG